MKRTILTAALLTAALLSTGCGTVTETTANTEIAEETTESPFQVVTSEYLDATDLSFFEEYIQKAAVGYGIPDDEMPTITLYTYTSSKGGSYTFDDQGRLWKYRNRESIFYNEAYSRKPSLTEDEMRRIGREVLDSCVPHPEEFVENSCLYYPKDTDEPISCDLTYVNEHSPGVRDAVIMRLDQNGELRSLNISYNDTEITDEQRAYFDGQAAAVIQDEVDRRLTGSIERVDYEITDIKYYDTNMGLYALYTVEYAEYFENYPDEPAYWAEGFAIHE